MSKKNLGVPPSKETRDSLSNPPPEVLAAVRDGILFDMPTDESEPLDLDAIKRNAEAANAGIDGVWQWRLVHKDGHVFPGTAADIELIKTARETILRLVERVRELETKITRENIGER